MAGSSDGALERIRRTVELSEPLALIFVAGPPFRARAALERIRAVLPADRPALWHRLDQKGGEDLVGAVTRSGLENPIVLVHGLENLNDERRAYVEAVLNVNRDRLREVRAAVIFWIPEGELASFPVRAPDLFHWRAMLVTPSDLEIVPDEMVESTSAYLDYLREEGLGELLKEPLAYLVHEDWNEIAIWLHENIRSAILDVPGSGKTTMMFNLMWFMASGRVGSSVPVLVGAMELSRVDELNLATVTNLRVPEQLRRTPDFVYGLAQKGELVLLCDGLDELPEPQQGRLAMAFERLADQWPRMRILIAGRQGTRVPSGWAVRPLPAWTVDRARTLWGRLLVEDDPSADVDSILAALEHSLTLLTETLPAPRFSVIGYHAWMRTLRRGLTGEMRPVDFLSEPFRYAVPSAFARRVLRRLALGVVFGDAQQVRIREVMQALADESRGETSEEEARRMARVFEDGAMLVSCSPGAYRFWTQSLETFLAARQIAYLLPGGLPLPSPLHPGWVRVRSLVEDLLRDNSAAIGRMRDWLKGVPTG
ncbi:MAG: hypothetical protein AB2A00_20140 [Myxococcota bacterium]